MVLICQQNLKEGGFMEQNEILEAMIKKDKFAKRLEINRFL